MAKELKQGHERVNVYYQKAPYGGLCPNPKGVDMNDYGLVCEYSLPRLGGTDHQMLETVFGVFNWAHDDITKEDVGFERPFGVMHTSMSMGDIVEINGNMYICEAFGWRKLTELSPIEEEDKDE